MKKSARIRRYGNTEFHVEFPICKKISKEVNTPKTFLMKSSDFF